MKDFDQEKANRLMWGIGINHDNCFQNFIGVCAQLTDKEFWYGLVQSYTSTDNTYRYKDAIKFLIDNNKHRSHKEYMMTTKHEREYFKKLPDLITVYRGMTLEEYESQEFGISWSFDKKVAEFFAAKYNRNYATAHLPKIVCEARFEKKDAVCYIAERKEREIWIYRTDLLC